MGSFRVEADDSPAVAEKPNPQVELSAEQIAQLIEDLGSEKYADREAAMRNLRDAGTPAIPLLAKAARSGDLETTVRAIRVLEALFTTGSLEAYEAAEVALEDLRKADETSVASRAENVLASMGEVRERRAVAALKELNGVVKSDMAQFGFAPAAAAGQEMITTVILNKKWEGDEEGLKHLERLRHLTTLYVVEDVLAENALNRLQRKLPHVKVQMRGGACLGVGGLSHAEGCEISLVNPQSAAAKAGLRVGDVIIAFNEKRGARDGEPLDFDRLVNLIKEHDAGDKVPVRIRRNGRELTLDVVLDEWK